MRSRKPVVVLVAALVTVAVFAAAPSLFARGGARGATDGGGGDISNSGNGGDVPIGGYGPSSGQPGANTGGMDFSRDGGAQKEITGDVIARKGRDDFRRFRDERNRRTAEPASAR